jgi:cold shock CspA family protein
MREGGKIVTYFEDRGFGFIRPDYAATKDTGDVFLHINNIRDKAEPRIGQRCMFEATMSSKHKLVAKDVELIEEN